MVTLIGVQQGIKYAAVVLLGYLTLFGTIAFSKPLVTIRNRWLCAGSIYSAYH